MAAGQPNNTGAIIQARMKSSRLPGKTLMPLPMQINGKPVLGWVIDALKTSRQVNTIILATSQEPEDDILVDFALKNGVEAFRGSEHDVLSRFAGAIEQYKPDTVVRITADNPILDITELDKLIAYHLLSGNEYTASANMPLGMNMEIVQAHILTAINCSSEISAQDREHVTLQARTSGLFKQETVAVVHPALTESIRLTIDYAADYAVLNMVAQFAIETKLTGLELINYISKQAPWLWQINNTAYQVKNYSSLADEIPIAIQKLKEFGLFRSSDLLKNAGEEN
ncbi:MAG TPA: hypothetical protein VK154_13450 [Chitinophagales bacterium]|nr:hypothetical protein [Chitinophagales bacterium]